MVETNNTAQIPISVSATDGTVVAEEVKDKTRSRNFLDRRPAIVHFTALAIFLTPFTLAPYLLMRRRVRGLQARLDNLAASMASLQKSANEAVIARNVLKAELKRTTVQAELSRNGLKELRSVMESNRSEQIASNAAVQSTIQQILNDRRATSDRLAILPQLGLSLADVAAFMHEVELYQGLPSRPSSDHGVEKLRTLALKLQDSLASREQE
ncbi:hypothetical protein BJ138DRAFT_1140313, partial [Hygrophoropsis aurantiaca]